MPAVGDLDRLWSPQPSSFCIVSRAITTDHFHARVLYEPSGKSFGSSIWEEIDDAMSLQITQECPVALGTTPGPVIDPQQARGGNRSEVHVPDQPQERIRTGGDGFCTQLACSRLSTKC
jgi:hypothetical protein